MGCKRIDSKCLVFSVREVIFGGSNEMRDEKSETR